MKDERFFVPMHSSDHLGDVKMSKKPLASLNLTILQIAMDKNVFKE